ncbi:hypothetical protein [Mycobacterium vicinigordonae]|uniref:CAP domain-containing protein n=1 Tax=Mycobacterium vicinigordonae TaxID=1719132 RepID=A0A7D6E1K7_9MYCO|nr:hypothetical protein [Mycobacterium vicinigordonae]QLL08710.1 hypothetical protein H0P51_07285 [Mycobacterium vicinigordonae]
MAIAPGVIAQAPTATADSADALRAAVAQMRTVSCPALRSDPVVEKVAQNTNDSSIAWLNHTARAVPVPEPLPVLKDFGYSGTKATMMQGAGQIDGSAIKGLLLEGWDKIPDCSYTDYGASVVRHEKSGFILMVVVLAGA